MRKMGLPCAHRLPRSSSTFELFPAHRILHDLSTKFTSPVCLLFFNCQPIGVRDWTLGSNGFLIPYHRIKTTYRHAHNIIYRLVVAGTSLVSCSKQPTLILGAVYRRPCAFAKWIARRPDHQQRNACGLKATTLSLLLLATMSITQSS